MFAVRNLVRCLALFGALGVSAVFAQGRPSAEQIQKHEQEVQAACGSEQACSGKTGREQFRCLMEASESSLSSTCVDYLDQERQKMKNRRPPQDGGQRPPPPDQSYGGDQGSTTAEAAR